MTDFNTPAEAFEYHRDRLVKEAEGEYNPNHYFSLPPDFFDNEEMLGDFTLKQWREYLPEDEVTIADVDMVNELFGNANDLLWAAECATLDAYRSHLRGAVEDALLEQYRATHCVDCEQLNENCVCPD